MQAQLRSNIRARWGIALPAVMASLMLVAALLYFHQLKRSGGPSPTAKNEALKKYSAMPLYFERNLGQADSQVQYLSHSNRTSLYLTDDSAVITMVGGSLHKGRFESPKDAAKDQLIESAVRIHLLGANQHPQFEALEPLRGRINYLIGKDPSKYHRNVPIFGRVREKGVYPGIDLVYYGTPEALEYDLIAAPGADTSKLKFAVEGGSQTTIDSNGNLIVATGAGRVIVEKPHVFQQDAGGNETPVEGSFSMASEETVKDGVTRREVTFNLASYDHSRTLRIDPVFIPEISLDQYPYSSYLGGSGASTGPLFNRVLFDISGGNIPLQAADGATDVAVDPNLGFAYVTGIAYSNNFPTSATPFQDHLAGANSPPAQNPNAFVTEFDPSQAGAASLVFSTYLGGSGDANPGDAGEGLGDFASGIAEDAGGNTFIVGQTFSDDFPDTASCVGFGQNNSHGNPDIGSGFIAKLDSAGDMLTYACYIGGTNNASESRVALFPAGCSDATTACQAYVVGTTFGSSGYPLSATPFQATLNPGETSAATFLVLNSDASLSYSTLYGGTGSETGLAIAVNTKGADPALGDGYITGSTFSSDLSVPGAQISTYTSVNSASNAFVAEFRPTNSGVGSLIYGTYLGGSGATFSEPGITLTVGDVGTGIAFDAGSGKIWVTGYTASTDFPVPGGGQGATPSLQTTNQAAASAGAPATAAFITNLDPLTPTSIGILYSTYFSGTGSQADPGGGPVPFGDAATGIALSGGNVFVTGIATSGVTAHSFPASTGACFQTNLSSGVSFGLGKLPVTSFVLQLDPTQAIAADQEVFSTLLGGSGQANITGGIQFTSPWIVVAGTTYSTDYPVTSGFSAAFQSSNATTGSSQAFLSVINPAGTVCPPTPIATETATATATATDTATATATDTATATATDSATATATDTATATATDTPTGTATDTPTATATDTPTATATDTATATATATDTATTTASETATATAVATETATATSAPTTTATATSGATATSTPTSAETPTATSTSGATSTPTSTPSSGATSTATATSGATMTATATSGETPTATGTSGETPTATMTAQPSSSMTIAPTITETATPVPTGTPAGQVEIVTPATRVASPGATISAGSFSYTPTETTTAQVISSVTVSITHPLIFQSLTLTAFLDGNPAGTVEVDAPNITASTVFTFNPVITIPANGSHSIMFSFSSVIAARMSSIDVDAVKLAGVGMPPPPGTSEGGGWLMLSFSLLGLAMMPLGNRQRRRATLFATMFLLMAVAIAGCGGGGGGSAAPSGQSSNASTQQISDVGISINGNPVGVSGLPIDLGTIHRVGG